MPLPHSTAGSISHNYMYDQAGIAADGYGGASGVGAAGGYPQTPTYVYLSKEDAQNQEVSKE